MNDDSAEWMAKFKASGQLWPDPHEGNRGDEDARQDQLGVVGHPTDEGQQVLGTCSPDAVQRVTRATCAHLHDLAIRSGYLVRPRKDPGQYRIREVAPIIRAAFETGLITEVP